MKKSVLIKSQLHEITTLRNLTAALEGVSSIRISQIKDRVLPGRECFEELWKTYSLLRASGVSKRGRFGIGARKSVKTTHLIEKPLAIIVASESTLGGSIDSRIVDYFIEQPNVEQAAVVVIGSHGASLLQQHGIKPIAIFSLPEEVGQADYRQIGVIIQQYSTITVYYQSYVSLSQQVIRQIDLINAVSRLANDSQADQVDIISERDYLFEPGSDEVIEIMESTMLQIALREVILDSRLAQLASRFTAMVAAEDKARQRQRSLFSAWRKASRDESDRQQHSVTIGESL